MLPRVSPSADFARYDFAGGSPQAFLRALNIAAIGLQAGAVNEGIQTVLFRGRTIAQWSELQVDDFLAAARRNGEGRDEVGLGSGAEVAPVVEALRAGGVNLPVEYRGQTEFTRFDAGGAALPASSEALDIAQVQALLAPYEVPSAPGSASRTYDVPGFAGIVQDENGRLVLVATAGEGDAHTTVRLEIEPTSAFARTADVERAIQAMAVALAEIQGDASADAMRLALRVDALGETMASEERRNDAARKAGQAAEEDRRDAQAAAESRAAGDTSRLERARLEVLRERGDRGWEVEP